MRYLAIDYGSKHTGLAICDPTETIVSPLEVIQDQKQLTRRISGLVETENVEAIVLGLPLNMDDSVGSQARLVFQFADRLKNLLDVPIHFQDERLSTFGAEEKLAPTDFTRKKKKKRRDAIAAAEILETFLQQKNA